MTGRHSITERFWQKVDVRGPGECWPWTARSRTKDGRGIFDLFGTHTTSNRAAWVLTHGDPGPLDVCHECDNPPCCNPAHLWVGTRTDNMQDCKRKGRVARVSYYNESNPNCKLSDEQVSAIRSACQAGGVTQKQLARQYGVFQGHISRVVRGTNRVTDRQDV